MSSKNMESKTNENPPMGSNNTSNWVASRSGRSQNKDVIKLSEEVLSTMTRHFS